VTVARGALLLAALLCAPAARADEARRTGLADGQNALLATMLGHGRELPGGCRFADGSAEDTVEARYTCAGGELRVTLYFTAEAPPGDAASAAFSVVVRDGEPPPGFLDALVESLRAHEGGLEWIDPPAGISETGARLLLAAAIGLALLGAVAQYRLTRPRPPAAPPIDRSARLILGGAVALYLASRLASLTVLPAFIDESIHIAWARGLVGHPLLAEFSVGKWLPVEIMRAASLLPLPPLVAARLAAVAAGLLAMLGCAAVARSLFTARAGALAGLLYVALPFTLLYDRLALADVFVLAFGVWSVWAALRLRAPRRARDGALLSLLLSAAIFSKPTGVVFAAAPPLVAALLLRRGERLAYLRATLPSLVAAALLCGLLVGTGYGAELLRGQASGTALRPSAEIVGNLRVMVDWLAPLLSPAVIAAAAAGAALGARRAGGGERFLFALALLLLAPWPLAAQTWYPRYLLPAVGPIVCLAARAIEVAAGALAAVVARLAPDAGRGLGAPASLLLAAALLAPALPRDRALFADPQRADLPAIEALQYVEGAGAGYGLAELTAFLEQEARRRPIAVVRSEAMNPSRYGIEIYLTGRPSFAIHTLAADEGGRRRLAALAAAQPTLLVSDRALLADPEPLLAAHRGPATTVWSYTRPNGSSGIEVWELASAPPAGSHGEAR
jgi:4-amino-4-deoxy-L-arabinose transferase-like glycosyltransferase